MLSDDVTVVITDGHFTRLSGIEVLIYVQFINKKIYKHHPDKLFGNVVYRAKHLILFSIHPVFTDQMTVLLPVINPECFPTETSEGL